MPDGPVALASLGEAQHSDISPCQCDLAVSHPAWHTCTSMMQQSSSAPDGPVGLPMWRIAPANLVSGGSMCSLVQLEGSWARNAVSGRR